MAENYRDNSGVLFRNENKQKPNHPDYSGRCQINGVNYYISAWSKAGAKSNYLSISFTPANREESGQQGQQEAPRSTMPTQGHKNDDGSGLPF